MHYCKHCGTPLSDDAKFCPSCGKSQGEGTQHTNEAHSAPPPVNSNPTPPPPQNGPKLCCPECGSRDLQILSETNFQTSVKTKGYSNSKGCLGYLLFGPLGFLCGNCGGGGKSTVNVNTTTSNAWICKDCGNKFRTKNDILKAIEQQENELKKSTILIVVFSVLSFFTLLLMFAKLWYSSLTGMKSMWEIYLIMPVYFAAMILALVFLRIKIKNTIEALYEEIREMENKMSRFQ